MSLLKRGGKNISLKAPVYVRNENSCDYLKKVCLCSFWSFAQFFIFIFIYLFNFSSILAGNKDRVYSVSWRDLTVLLECVFADKTVVRGLNVC